MAPERSIDLSGAIDRSPDRLSLSLSLSLAVSCSNLSRGLPPPVRPHPRRIASPVGAGALRSPPKFEVSSTSSSVGGGREEGPSPVVLPSIYGPCNVDLPPLSSDRSNTGNPPASDRAARREEGRQLFVWGSFLRGGGGWAGSGERQRRGGEPGARARGAGGGCRSFER